MSSSELLVEREGELLILALNRPEKRNALSFALLDGLRDALVKAADDASLRAVIVTGTGKHFCSGMDLGVLAEHLASNPNGEKIRKVQRDLQNLFCLLEELEKPTIAAIEGACVGGGLELALSCDLRVASSDAKLGLLESKIGMLPDLGGTVRLARLVGPGVAKEWIFTSRQYPAVRALELGLINELVVPGDALIRAKDLARECAANGPLALAWAKRVIDRSLGMSLRDGLELEQDAMSEILPSSELKEGVAAFLEKRAPKFR
jgi:enoyl-CoA hydratase/carnithine racemase